jgi:hypothetical protein
LVAPPPNGARLAETMALIDSRATADTSEISKGEAGELVDRRRSTKDGSLGRGAGNFTGGKVDSGMANCRRPLPPTF